MPIAERVVLIVADGLRPDAIDAVPTPHIDVLRTRGASCWHARTVQPSGTLTCHASMFLSLPFETHGVVGEQWSSPRCPVPGIVDVVAGAGKRVDLFYSWAPLHQLTDGERAPVRHHYQTIVTPEDDLDLAATAAAHIARGRSALTFVYLQSPDVVGHEHGWMSDEYLATVATVDEAVGVLLDAAWAGNDAERTAVLFLADHGGKDTGHGTAIPEVMTIPWVAAGPGVRAGHRIESTVSIMDTAPTIAHLLGLDIPDAWQGRIVGEALHSSATHAG